MDFGKILLKVVDIAKDYLESSNSNAPSTPQARPAQRPVSPVGEPTFFYTLFLFEQLMYAP